MDETRSPLWSALRISTCLYDLVVAKKWYYGGNKLILVINAEIDEKLKNIKNILFLCTIFSIFKKHHFTIINLCTITWKSIYIVCTQPTMSTMYTHNKIHYQIISILDFVCIVYWWPCDFTWIICIVLTFPLTKCINDHVDGVSAGVSKKHDQYLKEHVWHKNNKKRILTDQYTAWYV